MAYSEKFADRIRVALKNEKSVVEKKMFGGIAFMVKDRMTVGIANDDLMIRVPADKYEEYLKKPNVREMDFTGRPLKGFLYVSPEGIKTSPQLQKWIDAALEYAHKSPPEKDAKKKTAKKIKKTIQKKTTKKAVK